MKRGEGGTRYSEEEVLRLARDAYASNPIFDLKPKRSVLLVIDMQDEFVKPNWTPFWIPDATNVVGRIRRLMDFFRKRKMPVIFTALAKTHSFLDRPGTGSSMPNRYNGKFEDNASYFRNGKIWHELAPLEGELIIYKPSYGAFYDTPLETILKNLGRHTVVICGTLTNYCCGSTARQAYERGFKVVVGSDVTATNDTELHAAELKTLRAGFAMVLDSAEIMERLR